MRIVLTCFVLLAFNGFLLAQPPPTQPQEPESSTIEQQLENLTQSNEDMETEDDSWIQEMVVFARSPINLNYTDVTTLQQLKVLTPMQINNLMIYRQRLGLLMSIYEVQAIPGWDVETIRKIRPYIMVGQDLNLARSISERFKGGEYSILGRVTQLIEEQRGFIKDTAGKSYYPGSSQRLLFRFRYNYKNSLQYGFTGEKDPGEEFFRGSQKQGFDFMSAHFFARNLGSIKSLALGDFAVNFGQGLTQWMSIAFRKGPDITAIKRQSPTLRPYNSAGEIFFHRGVGITVGKNNWEATAFASLRNLDANFVFGDTLSAEEAYITSLQTSGLHRTPRELENKGAQRQLAFGGNAKYRFHKATIGVNAVQYSFKHAINRSPLPYNKYAISGKEHGNYSVDYSYTGRNFHFFGEAAMSNTAYPAFINGIMLSPASTVDFTALYRNISKGYQSLYTDAFTESTYPTNEKGMYMGISVKPIYGWRIDAYADVFRFPWLKYRVNAPSTGKEYFVQATYRPNRTFEIYTRYRNENKAINFNPDGNTFYPVVPRPRQNWRTQFTYKASPAVTLRSRYEAIWFDRRSDHPSEGFQMYFDIMYKPMMSKLSGNLRLQVFQTDDYDSRIYTFENDVLYSYSIPMVYGKGYRYYANLNYDVSKQLGFWVRWASTIYKDRQTVGSGYDMINDNTRTELKLQCIYKFN